MTRRRPLRTARWALVLAATLVAAAACGVPLDSEPRAIVGTTSTTAVGDVASANETGNSNAFLYFIANNQLINVDQDVPSLDAAATLTALFAGVPSGSSADVVSQIPTGTRLLGVRQIGTILVVDVSKDFDNLVGTGRVQATAQIVMTATDLAGIDQVSLRIDGQPTQVFSQVRGDADEVGACDYVTFLPTDDLVASWPLDRRAKQHLVTRRSMLLSQCPDAPSTGN